MTSKAIVDDFISQKKIAVIGVSRSGKKFGNMAYRELKENGYQLFPIHPEANTLEGDQAYPDLKSLPEPVGGVLVVVPPNQTEQVVREAAEAGINRVWMQQGSESDDAIRFCQENDIAEVHGECIMMFAGSAFFHKPHRWIWGLLGKLPK